MEVQLKNIGMIREANVKIDGLTVIAGENNSGKSTIGKLLFSIIKASGRYKEDLEENKEHRIFSLIEKNYFQLRRQIDFSDRLDLRELFYPPRFKKDIDDEPLESIELRLKIVEASIEKKIFKDNNKNKNLINIIKNNLLNIKKILLEDDNLEETQKRAFKKVLVSEFKGKISNMNFSDENSSIKVNDGGNQILNISLFKDNVKEFTVFDELYFTDATFIESPLLIQLSEIIDNSKTYFEDLERNERIAIRRPNVLLHIKDLNEKIKESTYNEDLLALDFFLNDLDLESLFEKLSKIMDGSFKYNKKIRDFLYVSNGKTYDSLNTATGIKSFGIIQLLLKSGYITSRSILILDEPEVHLHPKWQLKYAELVIELVKNDINVLVTSHSPYMIEALKVYSENKGLVDKTNFYLAEKNEEEMSSFIREVNDDMWLIFEKLSTPLTDLKMTSLDDIL